MPLDAGHHDRDDDNERHDPIPQWVDDFLAFMTEQMEKEGLCEFCASSSVACTIMATNIMSFLDEPEELADYLQQFTQRAVSMAEKAHAARKAGGSC